MESPKIPGGYIILSRKIIESEIWDKPPLYIKVWIYLLTKAQHKQYKGLKRGQLYTSIPEIIEACSWKVGFRVVRPTKDQIYQVIDWLRNPDGKISGSNDEADTKATMITTTKATHGLLINIDKYSLYQDPNSYESNAESNNERDTKATTNTHNTNKNVKNDKNINKSSCPKSKIYDHESIPYQLSLRLLHNIRQNNKEFKEPNLQNWSNDFRLMMERDRRTEEQIKYLIDWCQQDSFWKTNILSPSKLRKQFDQLVLRCKEERKKKSGSEQNRPSKNKAVDFVEIAEAAGNG